jgi:hypothetical protein
MNSLLKVSSNRQNNQNPIMSIKDLHLVLLEFHEHFLKNLNFK